MLHAPAEARTADGAPTLICTAEGLVAVPDGDARPGKDRPAAPAIPCPICLALHCTGGFPPPPAPVLPLPAIAAAAVDAPAPAGTAPGRSPFPAHRPRGPPPIV